MNEAFVYLWFDSKNRKFYLGKHKGTPDDGYTHSSTVMESFDVPPPHMKRRILAWGTDEEMSNLEVCLLTNRYERNKWNRYYNVKWYSRAIGDVTKILDEDGIKKWKNKISKAHKNKPKPKTSVWMKNHMKNLSEEERKYVYGHQKEQNHKWKGGISIDDNKKKYHKNNYIERKQLAQKLLREGMTYYEIKDKYPTAVIGIPYTLLPEEVKQLKRKKKKDQYLRKKTGATLPL